MQVQQNVHLASTKYEETKYFIIGWKILLFEYNFDWNVFLYFRELAEQVEQIAVLRVIDPAFPSVGKYNFTDARLDSRPKVVKGLWKIKPDLK